MKTGFPAAVAWRYLGSKKSHSAVTAISVVSVCGMAVATAAIICVLSVFNGFRSVISERLDTLTPDVIVTPAAGKVFSSTDSLVEAISRIEGVKTATPTLTDNALAIYDTREMPVLLKGVENKGYRKVTAIDKLRLDSVQSPDGGASFSIGAASRLGAVAGENVLLFAPRREGRVNLSNPAASFISDSVKISSVYQSQESDFDEDMIIADISLVRELLQYDDESSAIEIKGNPGTDLSELANRVSSGIGPEYIVKDRFRQQEMNFRMISIEKWVTFLLLFFILVIASFNIISSLSMLVIDKQKNISTLLALGMTHRGVGAVFWWESIYVALAGGISGIGIGIGLCLLQQHFGFIRIYSDSDGAIPYPVVLEWADIAVTMIPVICIALITAFVTAAFARNRSHDR